MSDLSDPARLRVALDGGATVEVDGGVLAVAGGQCPTVVLRLVPWRARSLAHVLGEWSAASRLFGRDPRPGLGELDLSRVLDAAADVAGGESGAVERAGGGRRVLSRQRLGALGVLVQRERRLSSLQRLAVVDAAAWWLGEERGGEEFAHALLQAACAELSTAQHAYLALISPGVEPDGRPEGTPS